MASTDTARKRPLEGVCVIDLTRIVAGPTATRMPATMGAEVVRVEWHDDRALDLLRGVRPLMPGGEAESVNRSGLFNNINAGKYGITLNMNLPQGRELFERLIANASTDGHDRVTAYTRGASTPRGAYAGGSLASGPHC